MLARARTASTDALSLLLRAASSNVQREQSTVFPDEEGVGADLHETRDNFELPLRRRVVQRKVPVVSLRVEGVRAQGRKVSNHVRVVGTPGSHVQR